MNDDNTKRVDEGTDKPRPDGKQADSNVSGASESGASPQLTTVTVRLYDFNEKWVADITAPGITPRGSSESYPLHDVIVYDGRVFMQPSEYDDMAPNEYRECKSLFYTEARC